MTICDEIKLFSEHPLVLFFSQDIDECHSSRIRHMIKTLIKENFKIHSTVENNILNYFDFISAKKLRLEKL